MYQKQYDQVAAALKTLGWTVTGGVAVASKMFDTAVGPKQALAYLENYGPNSDNYLLTGSYQSEGRNALEATIVQIPKTADVAAVVPLAERFSAKAEKAIADTYAAKLLARYPGTFD